LSGDVYKRRFVGDTAQCGCHWTREPGWGDVLNLCPIHKAHSAAHLRQYERERKGEGGGA
jgi:hypothetical protein